MLYRLGRHKFAGFYILIKFFVFFLSNVRVCLLGETKGENLTHFTCQCSTWNMFSSQMDQVITVGLRGTS